ncbi:hypothetical protein ACFQ6U_05935 [Streptomyces sp. NPDC056465]
MYSLYYQQELKHISAHHGDREEGERVPLAVCPARPGGLRRSGAE